MKDKENKWHISQDGDNTSGSSEKVQVPSSLLPTVLHRLGLPPEQALSELPVDDLIAKLKSDDWEVRVAAVRALGKLDTPVELLVSALDDEDGSVRAAAVHVLGNVGKQAPLHPLVAALHDADWHVRETAVLALGKQGQRVPHEVLITALHDTDGSVREAASLALQWASAEEKTSVSYGRLWEQKTMQDSRHDTTFSNGKESHTPFETVPHDTWDSTIEDNRSSEGSSGVREQVQAYAPQEHALYEEYGDIMSSRGEKITPPRRMPQKAWWAVVAITAILFFLLGGGMTMWLMPAQTDFIPIFPHPLKVFPFENPKYNLIAQNDIANALHLDSQQIITQLQDGKSMTEIAAAQGISAPQLQNIELKAFSDAFDAAVKSGDIDQRQADELMQQLKDNPQLLNKVTTGLFLANPYQR